jgi:hypothetical protein
MKTFREFILEASREEAEKKRLAKDNPDEWRVRNTGGGKWTTKRKSSIQGQGERRSQNLKPISKKELEDHAKRNLHPSPSKTANKALKIERERKNQQRVDAQSKSRETGKQHDVDHIQAQANRKSHPDRWHKVHPGDASDNRRVIPQSDNLRKNSKDTGERKITRSGAIRASIARARGTN